MLNRNDHKSFLENQNQTKKMKVGVDKEESVAQLRNYIVPKKLLFKQMLFNISITRYGTL